MDVESPVVKYEMNTEMNSILVEEVMEEHSQKREQEKRNNTELVSDSGTVLTGTYDQAHALDFDLEYYEMLCICATLVSLQNLLQPPNMNPYIRSQLWMETCSEYVPLFDRDDISDFIS